MDTDSLRVNPTLSLVHLDQIDIAPAGVDPTPAMVAAVARLGVLQPIVGEQSDDGRRVTVVDGRRRVLAARAAGDEQIPVMVFPSGYCDADLLTLTLHATRAGNPVAELRAVDNLLARGISERDISALAGIPAPTLAKLLTLRRLIPPLRERFDAGQVRPSVAMYAARLPVDRQANLARIAAERTVKIDDVKRERQAVVAVAIDEVAHAIGDRLDLSFTDGPTPPASNTPNLNGSAGEVANVLRYLMTCPGGPPAVERLSKLLGVTL